MKDAKLLHKKYKALGIEIPEELLFPEKQRFALVEKLFVFPLNQGLTALYRRGYLFSRPIKTFFSKNLNRILNVLEIDRSKFESETTASLSMRDSNILIDEGGFYPATAQSMACSVLLLDEDMDLAKSRPFQYRGHLIGTHQEIPKDSIQRKWAQVDHPKYDWEAQPNPR